MAEVFEISAIVQAKLDKLEEGMKRAEKIVSDSTKKLDTITKQFTPFASIAKGAVVALGAIQLATLGIKGLSLALAVAQGDFEKIEEIVRTLPFGIGAVAGAVIDLTDQITGAAEAAERVQRAFQAEVRLGAVLQRQRQQLELIGLTGLERRRAVERQRGERRVAAIGALGGDPQTTRFAQEFQLDINERALQDFDDKRQQQQDEAFNQRIKRERDEVKERERKQKAANARLLDLDTQLQVAQLQQQGRFLDANLLQIQASFDARVAAAESAAERERIARLGILELEAAKRAARRAGTGEQAAREIVLSRSAIGGQQGGAALAFDRDREIKVEDQDDVIQQLKLIVENTRGGVGAAIAAIAG